MHDGDGTIGEIDDLLGDGTEEMRIQSRQSAGTDHQMACVTGSCDQSLRRGDVEGVRFDLEIVGNAGRGNLHRIEKLVKNAFRALLTYGDWRDGVLIPLDDTEIFQLPAEHYLQGSMMQRSQIDGEPQGVS